MTTKFKFTIDKQETLDQVRQWFKDGRGAYRWTNKEIGNPRGDVLTPGDSTQAPHWAYVGQPESVQPEDIEVRLRCPVSLPGAWYPACERCQGTGKRSYQSIADIRGCSDVGAIRQEILNQHNHVIVDDDHFQCWSCGGGGNVIKPPTFKVKREYWGGYTVSDTGKNKCNKLCRDLEKHYDLPYSTVLWDYEFIGRGMGQGRFYTEDIKPFTLED